MYLIDTVINLLAWALETNAFDVEELLIII